MQQKEQEILSAFFKLKFLCVTSYKRFFLNLNWIKFNNGGQSEEIHRDHFKCDKN